jgi:hypothetical protein
VDLHTFRYNRKIRSTVARKISPHFFQHLNYTMLFGEVDPAALILATVAAFIGLETILRPLCKHVRKPRKAYTQYYRRAMINADVFMGEGVVENDWILSIAVSKTAFMGLWSWNTNWSWAVASVSSLAIGIWHFHSLGTAFDLSDLATQSFLHKVCLDMAPCKSGRTCRFSYTNLRKPNTHTFSI